MYWREQRKRPRKPALAAAIPAHQQMSLLCFIPLRPSIRLEHFLSRFRRDRGIPVLPGTAVASLVALLEQMTKALARFFVRVKGRSGDFRIDGVRIEIPGQRRFQLDRARSPGKIFLRRRVVASQTSLQRCRFVLQCLATLRFAVIEVRLANFPAEITEQSQEREKLGEPE